jgi:hypothetical protein
MILYRIAHFPLKSIPSDSVSDIDHISSLEILKYSDVNTAFCL